jgi:hypothetical protein
MGRGAMDGAGNSTLHGFCTWFLQSFFFPLCDFFQHFCVMLCFGPDFFEPKERATNVSLRDKGIG